MARILVALVLALAHAALAQVCAPPEPKNEMFASPDGLLTLYVQYDEPAWTLLEGDPLRVRWRRMFPGAGPDADAMPGRPAIHDSGWIVAGTATVGSFAVIEPTQGRTVMAFHLLKEFTRPEYRRYVDDQIMDAPPQWGASHTLRGFVEIGPEPYYSIRTWWGRRFVVDLKRARFVSGDAAISQACEAADRARVLQTLRAAVDAGPPEQGGRAGWSDYFPVRRAAHLAGLLEIHDALPLLQTLQRWHYIDATGGRGAGPPRVRNANSTRQYAQLSIRRLGATPEPLPVFRFPYEEEAAGGAEGPPSIRLSSRERAESVRDIRIGMTGAEVVLIIGTPDAMPFNRRYFMEDWEYDFDAADPFTLRIAWKDGTVAELDVIRPPRWKQGLARDEQLLAGEQ